MRAMLYMCTLYFLYMNTVYDQNVMLAHLLAALCSARNLNSISVDVGCPCTSEEVEEPCMHMPAVR